VYIPEPFRPVDCEEVEAIIRQYSFGTLVSVADDAPLATRVPFVLHPDERDQQRLWGHLARANPHARALRPDRLALAIFHGPDAYVSPSWYADAPNVPTWNFITVHAYGHPRPLHRDDPRVRWILEQTVAQHEARLPRPWSLDTVPNEYLAELIPGVLAFELQLTHVESQFKLNQNHSRLNRLGVIAALEHQSDSTAQQLAAIMRKRETTRKPPGR